ncbi:MAG: serine/threonine protein kinase [Myxococcales bacterium]|nr:serine/threonine protein kinase [Myxococcales bacterium]
MTSPAPNVGPYRIIERIGAGGMAEVFLAAHQGPEGLERRVALKRITPSYARMPEIRTMFIDEARLLARLTHPYIVQIHDLHPGEGGPWLVTEYIRGSDLRTLINHATEGLPIEVGLRIGLDVAEALAYAHGRRGEDGRLLGVVHRDLKPSNVMVREDGVVKLLDFGVAKVLHKQHQTQVGAIKGSLGYFSPEQIKQPDRIDRRADIFGIGILLYEALTGEHPFAPLDGPPVVMRMLAGDFLAPRAHRPSLPPAIDALIIRCLAVDPAERPQRMEEVAETIAGAMKRPLTFARLGAYVRDGVPPSTMRVALPGLAPEDSAASAPMLDSIDVDGADLTSSMQQSPADDDGYDSIDIDGADPTAQMPAPMPQLPIRAVPIARATTPHARPVSDEPVTGPGDELPTSVHDEPEMATAALGEAELPTFVAEGETMTVPAPIRPRPVGGLAIGLLLWGIIAGLVVALVAVLLMK